MRAGVVVVAKQGLQVVAILGHVQTADLEEVAARGEAECVADDPGCVVQRVIKRQRAPRQKVLSGDHRHRAGGLKDRGAGFHRAERAERTSDDDHVVGFALVGLGLGERSRGEGEAGACAKQSSTQSHRGSPFSNLLFH